MIWSYYIPTVWEDNGGKPEEWKEAYVYCLEEDREIDDPTYVIDITSYWDEGVRLYGRCEEVERGLEEDGVFVDVEEMEVFTRGNFTKSEFLKYLAIGIGEIFGDTDVMLHEGEESEFVGTNVDSVNTMIAKNYMDELHKKAAAEGKSLDYMLIKYNYGESDATGGV